MIPFGMSGYTVHVVYVGFFKLIIILDLAFVCLFTTFWLSELVKDSYYIANIAKQIFVIFHSNVRGKSLSFI